MMMMMMLLVVVVVVVMSEFSTARFGKAGIQGGPGGGAGGGDGARADERSLLFADEEFHIISQNIQ